MFIREQLQRAADRAVKFEERYGALTVAGGKSSDYGPQAAPNPSLAAEQAMARALPPEFRRTVPR